MDTTHIRREIDKEFAIGLGVLAFLKGAFAEKKKKERKKERIAPSAAVEAS